MTKDYNLLLEAAHITHGAHAQKSLMEGTSANYSKVSIVIPGCFRLLEFKKKIALVF